MTLFGTPLRESDPKALRDFAAALSEERPGLVLAIDRPRDDTGQWFIDIALPRGLFSFMWDSQHGFGFYAEDSGYGEAPNERLSDPLAVARRVAERVA